MSQLSQVFSNSLPKLEAQIKAWQEKQATVPNDQAPVDCSQQKVILGIRTRPFLDAELVDLTAEEEGVGGLRSRVRGCDAGGGGKMTVHVPVSRVRGPVIESRTFQGDISLGENMSNEDAYRLLIEVPRLLETALGGGVSCVLAYGQTGSGKTHTIQGLETLIASNLFTLSPTFAQSRFAASLGDKAPEDTFKFSLTCFELLGNECWDLLAEGDGDRGATVEIAEDIMGNIKTTASTHPFSSSTSLLTILSHAFSHRRTSSTLRNSTSSRSHLLTTIFIHNTLFPTMTPGRLVMVDLAGSERAADRTEHGAERMRESKAINGSLMALKDCVRARAMVGHMKGEGDFMHIPYRSSKLTMALKPVFDLEASCQTKTVVIAHVSPHLSDAPHSASTLTYVLPFRVPPTSAVISALNPAHWTHEQFVSWVRKSSTKIDPLKLAPNGETGRMMVELGEAEFVRRVFKEAAVPKGSIGTIGAKKFYERFWKLLVDAKELGKHESNMERMLQMGVTSWTHTQLHDYLETLRPAVNASIIAPFPTRGKVLLEDVGEAEFVVRMIQAAKKEGSVDEVRAREVWKGMWDLEIKSLTSTRKATTKKRHTHQHEDERKILELLDSQKDNAVFYAQTWGDEAVPERLKESTTSLSRLEKPREGVAQ